MGASSKRESRQVNPELNELLEKNYATLKKACFRLLVGSHNPDQDAADLAHAAIERALGSQNTYSHFSDEEMVGWLLKIAKNISIDNFRKEHVGPYLPTDQTPVVRVGHLAKKVGPAVAELGEQDRQILKLRVEHDLKFDEIAETTGLTPGNVRQRFLRTRNKLKKVLGQGPDSESDLK